MTKLDAALLKLEGALDETVDPKVRTLIDEAQQAIQAAKQVMIESIEEKKAACIGSCNVSVSGVKGRSQPWLLMG
jgi:hypothetical protein